MQEKEIEKYLRDEIKNLGGRAYKWVSPGNDGVPDRIVILPGRAPIFVELKTETGRLTRLQSIQIDRLTQMGQQVAVLYGKSQVSAFIKHCRERGDLSGV